MVTGLLTLSMGSTVNSSGSNMTVQNGFFLGNNNSNNATFNQTAGMVNMTSGTADTIVIGKANPSYTAALGISGGVFNATNSVTVVGYGGNGTVTVAGGTANFLGVDLSRTSQSGSGTLTLSAGTLNLGASGIYTSGGTGAKTINLNGGTLAALAGWSSTLPMTLGGAAAVDTTGGAISLGGVLSGTGSLTKAGAGTLTLTGSNSYSGGTTVSSGSLQIGSANALGTGGLTMNGGTLDLNGNSIAIAALSGSTGASITNTVSGTGTLSTTVASGTSTYAGSIAGGAGAVALTKEGAGKLILSGSLSMAGLNVNDGVAELVQSGSIGALAVSGSGTITLTAHTGGNPYKVIETSSLSIAAGGNIDLWNNAMIVQASGTSENAANLATVKAAVNVASNGLQWNGAGLGSTTAFNEAQPGHTQALALMVYDNTVINQGSFEGVSGLGYFDGGSPVGFNQVLVKLTYLGDFNGDGVVNASDYTWLDGFALSGNVLGDLNGDGVVNATDYTWLDGSALNQSFGILAAQQSGSGILPASPVTAGVPGGTGTIAASPEAVPEPGTLGMLLVAASGLLGFRRKEKGSVR